MPWSRAEFQSNRCSSSCCLIAYPANVPEQHLLSKPHTFTHGRLSSHLTGKLSCTPSNLILAVSLSLLHPLCLPHSNIFCPRFIFNWKLHIRYLCAVCSNGKCNVLANVSLSPSTWFLHLSVAFNQWSCISCSLRGHLHRTRFCIIKLGMGNKVSRWVLTYFTFECRILRMQRHARDAGKDAWCEQDIILAGLHWMCYFSVVFLGKQALMVKSPDPHVFLQEFCDYKLTMLMPINKKNNICTQCSYSPCVLIRSYMIKHWFYITLFLSWSENIQYFLSIYMLIMDIKLCILILIIKCNPYLNLKIDIS